MASYDYRCRTCDSLFEVQRPVSAVATAVACPSGHSETTRVFSAVAVTGGSTTGAAPRASAPAGGGGCCGGGCCG